MKRTNLNFVVDAVALFGFFLLTTTGILMRYLLPPGSGHSTTMWGLDRHEWGGLHFWISMGFFAVLAIHLVLHWKWIVCVAAGRPSEQSGVRAGLGVLGLATVLALAAAPLLAPVEVDSEASGGSDLSAHSDEDAQIRGSMTLADVERLTGASVGYLTQNLGLPPDTPADEQLGRLRREHGFEMSEVRAAVQSYSADN